MVGIVGTNKLFTFFWNETQYYAVVFKVVQSAKKKRHQRNANDVLNKKPGLVLLSHTAARAVPSALKGLTSVFGMGTGVALSLTRPENNIRY